MQPGDTTHRLLRIRNRSTGAGVGGLVLGDLTLVAAGRGYGAAAWTAFNPAAVLTDLTAVFGAGIYGLQFTAPAAAGWWRLIVSHATHEVWSASWEGELEPQDLASIFATVVRPVVRDATSIYLGTTYAASLVAYRYASWQIPIVDDSGDPVDLSGYTSLALSVRSKDQTSIKLDASHGSPTGFVLTGSAGGILAIEWPESTGSGAADIYSWLTTGVREKDPLYYEVVGNLGGDAAKTVPIIRSSPLTLLAREVGT